MELLCNSIKNFLNQHGLDKTYLIAVSGGLDSTVLLHLFFSARKQFNFNLKVVYVNHLTLQADAYEAHCKNICEKLEVEFITQKISATCDEDLSPEDLLRKKRYEALLNLVDKNTVLVTAHHQNDQAETILIQLFRGAGPKGLAAMPAAKKFGEAIHARPLLNFTRDELTAYAKLNNLKWIEDETNSDVQFTRNFLRHELIPLLEKRWPTITKTLSRSAVHCAQTQGLLESYLGNDLEIITIDENFLDLEKFLQFPFEKQIHLFRFWLGKRNLALPNEQKLLTILKKLLAKSDRMPHVRWQNIEFRRFKNKLYVNECLASHDCNQSFIWDLSEDLVLKNIGTLKAVRQNGKGLRADFQKVSVSFRKGGEIFRSSNSGMGHELKKLFQTWNVPPWLRNRIPLIFVENELAAVVGYGVAINFLAKETEEGFEIQLI